MPENSDSTSTRSSKVRIKRRPSVAPREVVLGLDKTERTISLAAAFIALALALITAVEWARNLPTVTSVAYTTAGCPKAYPTHKGKLCEDIVSTSQSQWEIKFFFILVVALCLLYFAVRRKRAGVACFAVFLGLGLGIGVGLLFFLLGAWLIVRAYRLQKYGDPTLFGSNRAAKEIGAAKREARSTKSEPASASSPTRPTKPEASKRYTPKKPPRRR